MTVGGMYYPLGAEGLGLVMTHVLRTLGGLETEVPNARTTVVYVMWRVMVSICMHMYMHV
ncbi:hypothetical protein EON65_47345 [archaeon]|nr:MAG: hypothetical protein EON65_47345 [archaeon]